MMEYLILLAALAWLGTWSYHKGKHVGSVKGYNAGRWRRRR